MTAADVSSHEDSMPKIVTILSGCNLPTLFVQFLSRCMNIARQHNQYKIKCKDNGKTNE
jgi:hypothetical protein